MMDAYMSKAEFNTAIAEYTQDILQWAKQLPAALMDEPEDYEEIIGKGFDLLLDLEHTFENMTCSDV